MKKAFPILLFGLVSLLYACSKTKPILLVPPQSITASKNGSDWTATPIDSAVNDSLIVHAKGPNDVLRMKFLSLRTRADTILDDNESYYTTDAAGKIVNRFKLDTAAKNVISVLVTGIPNTITGQFTLRFKIYSSTTNVDTGAVTFTNGKFTLRVR